MIAGNIFRNIFIDQLYTQMKLSRDLDGRNPFGSFGERWVKNSRRAMCICNFWISQPNNLQLRTVKLKVSTFKTIQNFEQVDWRLDEQMQPVAVENRLLIQRVIINLNNFGQFRPIKVPKKAWKKWILNYIVQKQKSWMRPWRKKPWQLPWGKTSLNTMKNQIKIQFLLRNPLQGTKCTIWQSSNFLRKENVHWQPDWQNAASGFREQRLDSNGKKHKNLGTSWLFRSLSFPLYKTFPKKTCIECSTTVDCFLRCRCENISHFFSKTEVSYQDKSWRYETLGNFLLIKLLFGKPNKIIDIPIFITN